MDNGMKSPLTNEHRKIVAEIKRLYRREEPLNIAPVKRRLRDASEIYQKEYQMLWQAFSKEDAFNADPEKWKRPAHPERIVEALTMARDLEEKGIAEIEHALSEGNEVPK